MIAGVDTSWPQGAYSPSGDTAFLIAGAVSLDGGSPFVQDTYHSQIDNAIAAGVERGHYAFNGRTDSMSPSQFAQYFVANLYRYTPGDALVLDVESSEGGAYPPWSWSEALEFVAEVKTLIPRTQVGIYGDLTIMQQSGWGELRKVGCPLWIAYPGADPGSVGEWGPWDLWQWGIVAGVDQDYSKQTLVDTFTITNKKGKRKRMSELVLLWAHDGTATPQDRGALVGRGFWLVFEGYPAVESAAEQIGGPAVNVLWGDWDAAYEAAVATGFIPQEGQNSRTVGVIPRPPVPVVGTPTAVQTPAYQVSAGGQAPTYQPPSTEPPATA